MKIFNFKLLFILLIFSMTIPSRIIAEEIKLASLEWPPYVGTKLSQYGFTSEIVKEIFNKAGYKVKYNFMPWARVLKCVERGNYDAAYPAYFSKERAEKYAMSEPIAHGPLVLFKRKSDSIKFTKLIDLKPYKIGVVRGYVNTPEFDNAAYLNKEAVNSDEQNIKKLLKRRIDLAVVDKYTGLYLIKTKDLDPQKELNFIDRALENKTLHVAFSKKLPNYQKIVEQFNSTLKELQKDNTLTNIIEKQGF